MIPLQAGESNLNHLNLNSKNYILYSVDDDQIIASQNSDQKLSAASINKVLTTITALDLLKGEDLDTEISVYPESLYYLDREASKARLEANQIVSLREVLYAIMLPSGADATSLMSLYIFKDQDSLVDAMNQKAQEIGMRNTQIKNTAGLDEDGQYTTLEDLLILLQYALQNEDFEEIYSKASYTFAHGDLVIENPMLMMAQNNPSNYIKGAKSGYTLDAGRSLSSVGSNGSQSYIFISTQAGGGSYEDNEAFHDANLVYSSLFDETINTEYVKSSGITNASISNFNPLIWISSVLLLGFGVIMLIRTINIQKIKRRRLKQKMRQNI